MSQLKWGVLLSYLSMGLAIAVSLVYTPFMLRLLGQSEWGLYQLVASVVGYLHLLSFGFGGAYIRFYSREAASDDEDAVARLNGLFLAVFVIIGLVCLLLGVLLLANSQPVFGDKLTGQEIDTARILIGLMTFTVAVSFPASVFSSFVIANERFVFQRILDLLRVVITPALSLAAILMGQKSIGVAMAAAAVALAVSLVNINYCFRRLRMRFTLTRLDVSLLREIAVFSSFIFINMVVDQVNWNADKFILGRVGGTAIVAVYALAAQLNSYYISLSTAVSNVFVPRVNRLVVEIDDSRELTHLLTRVGRVQFLMLALVASGLVVFGEPFIVWWAGDEYAGAYPIALLLALPATIPLIQSLGIEIQRARNMHQFRSWLYLGIAIANVGISIPLAQRFGGVGAAAGTALAMLIGNGLIMNWYYDRRVGLDMHYFWWSIVGFMPALLPVALLGFCIMAFVDLGSTWAMAVSGAVFVGVYCASMWLIGMNEVEKDLVRRPIRRLIGR